MRRISFEIVLQISPAATVDSDGCGSSQLDSDGDGFHDGEDAFPIDENEHIDTDNDGIGDNADNDDDNDGWDDTSEIDCSTNSTDENSAPLDTDSDGVCDVTDDDDDNDGWNDTVEIDCSTNSTDLNSAPPDTDGDGICDILDETNDNLPPPGYEFGNNSEDPEPVVCTTDMCRDGSNRDPSDCSCPPEPSNGIPGFTSTLLFTAIAGALMHLKRRQNY